MTEPALSSRFDRRHPRISHEELRRQLLEADEERFCLRNEIHAARPAARVGGMLEGLPRRTAVAIGTLLAVTLAGGVAWQMCTSWARAADRSSVRVATVSVPVRTVAEPQAASDVRIVRAAAAAKRAVKVHAVRTAAAAPHAAPPARSKKTPPRPLSPGEFGRRAAASW